MLKVTRHAYLQTRLSIYATRLLTEQQFVSLLKQPLEEILPAVANQGLQKIEKKLIQSHLSLLAAGNMDNLFLSVFLGDAQIIIRSLSGVEHEFFVYWMRRFELKNLKTIIRGKSLQRPVEQIQAELTIIKQFSLLPIETLLNMDSIADILKQLENTSFSSIAHYADSNYEAKEDIFTIETAINHEYFSGLKKRLNKLVIKQQDLIQPLMGSIIDLTNLIWLLRYRLLYGFSSSHCYFLLVSGGLYLNANNLARLSKIENIEQLNDLLPDKISEKIIAFESIHQIELSLEKHIILLARMILKTSSFSLAHVFAYLVLREKQLSQLHALFKGKLLHLPDSEIAIAMGVKL
ncbi:MAG: V-type ATPase subunit [Pseudomonadota bacterium]